MKANCYDCKYRRNIAGDAHSACHHPDVKAIHSNPLAVLAGIMGGVVFDMDNTLNVKGIPDGIRSGWFAWPVNFDPVWLLNCDGFTKKDGDE